ncbi:DUF4304 domain-containing protein [Pedobacter sp. AW31-3R]|uniref:DUF4304 domain-containing protein n=1 Tax=Pedobacter sp. AW31-3R TaxID=3445781 RepID=UPI003F9F8DC6
MDLFKDVIKKLTPLLKQMGFNKKSNTFYIGSDRNYGIVNFQKSRDSTATMIKFTVNFGIYSNVLGRLEYDYDDVAKPKVEQCHWQTRIGSFMVGNPDHWWIVDTSQSLSAIASNVIEIIQSGIIPEINKRLSDEGLIECWMNGSFAGTTEFGRFKYLTTLLKTKGEIDTLNQVVETFMQQSLGRPNGSKALEHLKNINYSK